MSNLSSAKVKLRAMVGNFLAKLAAFRIVMTGLDVAESLSMLAPPLSKVAILSFFGRQNGISAGALWQLDALGAVGIDSFPLDATRAIRNPWFKIPESATNNVTCVVMHTDGQRIAVALNALPKDMRNAFRVGYCAWELPDPPLPWGDFDRFLHEVWTPSEFSRNALAKMCKKPVRVVRHVVFAPANVDREAMRHRLKLAKSDFVMLAMADVRSSLARKNPIGAIAAFRKGLSMHANSVLILKVSGAEHDPVAFASLQTALQNIRVVLLLDRLSMAEQWQLYAASDVFVSLHRAEGYGLPMAEAMAMARPVVATAWSGNLDFMHAGNAALVDFKLVEINDPQGVYKGSTWAEPSMDHAAEWLSRLYASTALRAELGGAAAKSMTLSRQLDDFTAQIGTVVFKENEGVSDSANLNII